MPRLVRPLGAPAALLGVLVLAISGIGWGDYSYQWYQSIDVAAAGTTAIYFPPPDSTNYTTWHENRVNHLWITKSAGSSTDSIFVWSSSFAGAGVARLPMYDASAAVIWQEWAFPKVKGGIDSVYIHSAAAGTFHVTARD